MSSSMLRCPWHEPGTEQLGEMGNIAGLTDQGTVNSSFIPPSLSCESWTP